MVSFWEKSAEKPLFPTNVALLLNGLTTVVLVLVSSFVFLRVYLEKYCTRELWWSLVNDFFVCCTWAHQISTFLFWFRCSDFCLQLLFLIKNDIELTILSRFSNVALQRIYQTFIFICITLPNIPTNEKNIRDKIVKVFNQSTHLFYFY